MKSRWVKHKGKRIFIADFSNLGADANAVRNEANSIKETIQLELPGSVRAITWVEGTYGNPEVLQALSDLLPVSNKYIRMRALVGIGGFRKYFLDAFTKLVGSIHFKQFDTLDQALDWIAEA
jgi:hypothetical protein